MVFKEVEAVGPKMWESKPGQSIIGVLISSYPKDEARDISARYVLENNDGQHLIWGSHTLDERMLNIKIGQLIRITRKEDKLTAKKKTIKIFKVEIDDGNIATEESISA